MQAKLQTAIEALEPFLGHKKDCAVHEGLGWNACTCGLEASLTALRSVVQGANTETAIEALLDAMKRRVAGFPREYEHETATIETAERELARLKGFD
jgi:hypothetical protein